LKGFEAASPVYSRARLESGKAGRKKGPTPLTPSRDGRGSNGGSECAPRQDTRDGRGSNGDNECAPRQSFRDGRGSNGGSECAPRQDTRDGRGSNGDNECAPRQDTRDGRGSNGDNECAPWQYTRDGRGSNGGGDCAQRQLLLERESLDRPAKGIFVQQDDYRRLTSEVNSLPRSRGARSGQWPSPRLRICACQRTAVGAKHSRSHPTGSHGRWCANASPRSTDRALKRLRANCAERFRRRWC